MMRKFVVPLAAAVLIVGAAAGDAAACHFRRRCREYPPAPFCPAVYVPCVAPGPSASGGDKATGELVKEITDLVKNMAKPLPPPEMPADVARILAGK